MELYFLYEFMFKFFRKILKYDMFYYEKIILKFIFIKECII